MKTVNLTDKDCQGLVNNIIRELAKSTWRPDYIVGVNRGGLYPALLLSHYLEIPMYPLNVSLRDSNVGPESNLWMAEDAFGYPKDSEESTIKNILIVDDINDSGATINWILEDWPSGCLSNDPAWQVVWNNNVKFAVMVDNLSSKCNVKMDFVGMEINKEEDPQWIVFPWETWWK